MAPRPGLTREDGDGRLDYLIGNPGDESFILRNLGPGPDRVLRLTPAQVTLTGDLAFGPAALTTTTMGTWTCLSGAGLWRGNVSTSCSATTAPRAGFGSRT